jgi:hypothetical protein
MTRMQPIARGSLMIRRALARADSIGPTKVSVIDRCLNASAGEAILAEASDTLLAVAPSILFVKSLSTGSVEVTPCRATDRLSFAV